MALNKHEDWDIGVREGIPRFASALASESYVCFLPHPIVISSKHVWFEPFPFLSSTNAVSSTISDAGFAGLWAYSSKTFFPPL